MEQRRRIRRKTALIGLGLLVLCVLRAAPEPEPERGQALDEAEAAVSPEQAAYLFDALRRACGEESDLELAARELQAQFGQELPRQEELWDTLLALAAQRGAEGQFTVEPLLALARQDGRILAAGGAYDVEAENPAFSDEGWEALCFRQARGLVWHRGGEDGGEAALLDYRVENQAAALSNVWLEEAGDGSAVCFFQDCLFTAESDPALSGREAVADLAFAGGRVTDIRVKAEKKTGRLLRRKPGEMDIEGAGTFPVAETFQGYRLYGTLKTCAPEEIPIGFSYADYVLEGGKICAALLRQDETMQTIRVLLRPDGAAGVWHDAITLEGEGGLRIETAAGTTHVPAGEEVCFTPSDERLEAEGRIRVCPEALTDRIQVKSLTRSQGTPSYHGTMEIVKEPEGLCLINEVLLEEYLCAVVPSEMPASYPMEALKAQSICARTYAYRNMLSAALPAYGAHVDDSTAYQVYNNLPQQERTTQAVRETKGQLLYVGDQLAGTYYYSTSCGYGTDPGIWKTAEAAQLSYLKARHIAPAPAAEDGAVAAFAPAQTPDALEEETAFRLWLSGAGASDFERDQPWYRWSYTVSPLYAEALTQRLLQRRQAAPGQVLVWDGQAYGDGAVSDLGEILDLRIERRLGGGIADELVIEGSRQRVKVVSEYAIRSVLCDGRTPVVRQDGSEAAAPTLLPSAFLVIDAGKQDGIVVGYRIIGGGYGHGVGMSQNGAAGMAGSGMNAQEILAFFYEGSHLEEMD